MTRPERCLVVLLLACTPWTHAAQLRLDGVLGGDVDDGFARADAPRELTFPRDHGAHPRYRSEWWYLTVNLKSARGEEFGVQFTLFRQALRPRPVLGGPWDASQIYLAHLALTDVAGGRHREAERLARGHPQLAGVRAAPFGAWLDGWSLAAAGPGLEALELRGAAPDFAVQLRLDPVKPLVLQGQRGFSPKGPGQASYYYSLPRLTASGEVRSGDRVIAVSGSGWLDREWSTSVLSGAQQGWDWFALQLDDGEELMMFQLRRRDGRRDPYDQGVAVDRDGVARALGVDDFALQPLRSWIDDAGVAWPVSWALTVEGPDGPRHLRVEAALDDQRMDTLLTYWEGLVRVFDGAGKRIGAGYMELTGYE